MAREMWKYASKWKFSVDICEAAFLRIVNKIICFRFKIMVFLCGKFLGRPDIVV